MGYSYNYSVDIYGNVYKDSQLLHPFDNSIGYLSVRLKSNGKRINKYVHRLVWEAFNGPIPLGYEINHIDHNKYNNNLCNLELVTHSDNIAKAKKFYGEKFGRHKSFTTKKIQTCVDCGKIIDNKATRCQQCYIVYRNSKNISKVDIQNALIKYQSYEGAGRYLNVSGNCVRKYCRKYGLPIHKHDLKIWLASRLDT